MSEQDKLVTQFTDVTGMTADRAQFYLESSNNNLQLALASFFENEHEQEPDALPSMPTTNIADSDDDEPLIPIKAESPLTMISGGHEKKKSKKKTNSSDRVVTLHTMNKSSSEDEEEQGQAFYAGGSERSGQQVLGPRRNPNRDYVAEIFRSAQESGAEIIDPRNTASTSSNLFGGTGYRLGQTLEDNVSLPENSFRPNLPQNLETVVLRLWSNGFSINDNELRLYEDPQNKAFLQSLNRGETPAELRKHGNTVHIEIESHSHEEYKKSQSKLKAFSGAGHTLGSPAPNITDAAVPTKILKESNNNEENEKRANEELNLVDTQPTTTLQVRLLDGSRISARFNLTHTISDIRNFIIRARPQYIESNFNLLSGFPSKELNDGTETIEKAGLLNASILQRMK